MSRPNHVEAWARASNSMRLVRERRPLRTWMDESVIFVKRVSDRGKERLGRIALRLEPAGRVLALGA